MLEEILEKVASKLKDVVTEIVLNLDGCEEDVEDARNAVDEVIKQVEEEL